MHPDTPTPAELAAAAPTLRGTTKGRGKPGSPRYRPAVSFEIDAATADWLFPCREQTTPQTKGSLA